jgi:DNA-binding MarR family transcriptional regulator
MKGYFEMTPKRQAVLTGLYDLEARLGRWPTMREISTALDLSPATVQGHVNKLAHDGFLEKSRPGRFACNYLISPKGLAAIPASGAPTPMTVRQAARILAQARRGTKQKPPAIKRHPMPLFENQVTETQR